MRTQKSFQNHVFTQGMLYEKNVGHPYFSPCLSLPCFACLFFLLGFALLSCLALPCFVLTELFLGGQEGFTNWGVVDCGELTNLILCKAVPFTDTKKLSKTVFHKKNPVWRIVGLGVRFLINFVSFWYRFVGPGVRFVSISLLLGIDSWALVHDFL